MEERAVMTDDVSRGLLGLLTQLCIVYQAGAGQGLLGRYLYTLEPTHHRSQSNLVT